MLSVDKRYRKRGIGSSPPSPPRCPPATQRSTASSLVRRSIEAMKEGGVEEVRPFPV